MRTFSAVALAVVLAGCVGAYYGAPVFDSGSSPSRGGRLVHVVQAGDTLYSIAWDAGLDYRALAEWNGIAPPYLIRPGEKLSLRPPHGRNRARRAGTAETSSASASPSSRRSSASPAKSPDSLRVPAWVWPAKGRIIRRFSRNAASRGIDIAGKAGETVRSAADGRVVYAGDGLRGYGELIIVKHNDLFLSAYAHNRKLLVHEGEEVRRGQPIAEMGSTGTNRVKLHFEIRKEGVAVNPLQYLPKS